MTHGVRFLPQCDTVVVMTNGAISETGTYSELVEANGAFAQFLHTYQSTHQAEEKGDGKHLGSCRINDSQNFCVLSWGFGFRLLSMVENFRGVRYHT